MTRYADLIRHVPATLVNNTAWLQQGLVGLLYVYCYTYTCQLLSVGQSLEVEYRREQLTAVLNNMFQKFMKMLVQISAIYMES